MAPNIPENDSQISKFIDDEILKLDKEIEAEKQ